MTQLQVILWLAFALSLLSLLSITRSQDVIQVFPDCGRNRSNVCTDLDEALERSQGLSNTVIMLVSGTHVIRSPHEWALHDIQDVSLEGEENGSVVVKCDTNYSLSILNATNLQIANVTFSGCGLTGSYLKRAKDRLRWVIKLEVDIPHLIKIGVFIGLCKNLSMKNVVITNTSGIGLVGINVMGRSEIVNSNFTANNRPKCSPYKTVPLLTLLSHDPSLIGGGLYLLYQDVVHENTTINSSLLISGCHFLNNAECGYAGYTNINYQYFNSKHRLPYIIGGGGGMSVFMAQKEFSMSMNVESSIFYGNEARFGSGVHIGLYINSHISNITFAQCLFDGNGGSRSIGGAGIAAFLNLLRESDLGSHNNGRCLSCKIITIVDSNFTNNQALGQGGAVLGYSLANSARANYDPEHYDNVMTFKRCRLASNVAKYGSAVYASQRSTHGLDGIFGLNFEDVLIENNAISVTNSNFIKGTSSNYVAALDLRSINLVIAKGNLTIKGSNSSGLYIWSSLILMMPDTSLILEDNRANRGGGLYLEGYTPVIILSGNCTLALRNNHASTEGGGIFFYDSFSILDNLHPLDSDRCFLFGSDIYLGEDFGGNIFTSNNKVYFTGNEAPLGSAVYGSSLSSCPWARNFSAVNVLLELHYNYSSTFFFDEAPVGVERVSSDPLSIVVADGFQYFESYPGQVNSVDVQASDIFGEEIEAVLASDIYDEVGSTTLGTNGFIYKIINQSIPLQIRGIYEKNVTVILYSDNNLVSTSINVYVKECPIGFVYDGSTCVCNITEVEGIKCDNDNVSIIIVGQMWLGCLSDECLSSSDLVLTSCRFNYCTSKDAVYNPMDTSNQCSEGSYRDKVMCGGCKEGYSSSFGSQCRKCENTSAVLVTFFFICCSLVLFFLMAVVRITIDRVWTNMILFYCNIVFPYTFIERLQTRFLEYALYPVRIVSQNRFSSACYYSGLTALDKTAIGLLYPVYLFIIMLVFALLCRHSSFMSRHFTPAKTLMTLFYFCYITTFRACADILAPKLIKNVGKTFLEVRWLIDPNVLFFRNLHGFLGVVCVCVFSLYLIPSFLLLLFPSQVYKRANRIHPFLDIIWAPFKPKYRSWAAIRLFFSVVIITVSQYVPTTESVIVNIFFVATFLFVQTTIQPFKDELANIIDSFLVLVVLFMHIVGSLLRMYNNYDYITRYLLASFGVFFLVLSYVLFLVTFVWYSRENIKRLFVKLRLCCLKFRRKRDLSFVIVEANPTHSSVSCVPQSPHSITDYSRFRESILDDEQIVEFDPLNSHACRLDDEWPLEPIEQN